MTWVTRGVNLGNWRNYLDIAYDDMFLGDAQWSMNGHCTPGATTLPARHAEDRHDPDDAGRRHATPCNGKSSTTSRSSSCTTAEPPSGSQVDGVDPLLAATRPVARDFYWVNHTCTHAYLGCKQDFAWCPGSA